MTISNIIDDKASSLIAHDTLNEPDLIQVNNSIVCGFLFDMTSQKTKLANRDAKHIDPQVTHWASLFVCSELSLNTKIPDIKALNSGRRITQISNAVLVYPFIILMSSTAIDPRLRK